MDATLNLISEIATVVAAGQPERIEEHFTALELSLIEKDQVSDAHVATRLSQSSSSSELRRASCFCSRQSDSPITAIARLNGRMRSFPACPAATHNRTQRSRAQTLLDRRPPSGS